MFCRDKHVLVATKHVFCRDKSMLAATKRFCVCRDKINCVCRDKRLVLCFVVCREKIILAAAPANDIYKNKKMKWNKSVKLACGYWRIGCRNNYVHMQSLQRFFCLFNVEQARTHCVLFVLRKIHFAFSISASPFIRLNHSHSSSNKK